MVALLPECMIPADDKACAAFTILQDKVESLIEEKKLLLEALKGVVAVADRRTKEFDAARTAIARAENRLTKG